MGCAGLLVFLVVCCVNCRCECAVVGSAGTVIKPSESSQGVA